MRVRDVPLGPTMQSNNSFVIERNECMIRTYGGLLGDKEGGGNQAILLLKIAHVSTAFYNMGS